jgi:proline iminopeptidase
MDRLQRHPASIVHSRYDMVCPILSADELARAWPAARYTIVPDAGHSVWETAVRATVVAELERFKSLLG